MAIELCLPRNYTDIPVVTITAQLEFTFNNAAIRTADFGDEVTWLYIYKDSVSREVFLAPAKGQEKPEVAYKLSGDKNYRFVSAAKVFNEAPWLKAVSKLPEKQRKFALRRYHGTLPKLPIDTFGKKQEKRGDAWRIQVCPAFENNIDPDDLGRLDWSAKGIYRYRDCNDNVIYIGKGFIRSRFVEEPNRKNWNVIRIEYSLIFDDEDAYSWENHHLDAHKDEHGHFPVYNNQSGHRKAALSYEAQDQEN